MKLILTAKNSTATGVDHIDNTTLKLVAKEIAPALTKIINLSFKTSTFPKIYKQSKIIPLLKPDKPALECASYRPVNQLVSISKMVEREAFGQLVIYLEENKLFHPNQHGGRKGHSTATALIQMHDQWIEDMEAGKIIGVTLYDQSAAFDVCSHSILIEKLKILGLEETALEWMTNYLSGRNQSVLVDGYLSAPIDLPPCSVVQGGVGSGILYLCFTVDLPDTTHNHPVDNKEPEVHCEEDGDMVTFVDDATHYVADEDAEKVTKKISEKFLDIEKYMNEIKLVINGDKSHLVVLSKKNKSGEASKVILKAGRDTIEQSTSEKLLGAVIDSSGNFKEMIRDGKKSVVKQVTT